MNDDDASPGDEREWMEGLYTESGPQLLAYLAQRTADAATAEDLLQETFAAALRHPERVRASSSARAYLFGIALQMPAASESGTTSFWSTARVAKLKSKPSTPAPSRIAWMSPVRKPQLLP